MNYIEIEKDLIPYRFTVDIGVEEYEIEVGYNQRFDFFTVDLYLGNEALAVGEKLILNRPLFNDINDRRFPPLQLVPRDRSGMVDRITYDNMGETVLLYVEG